MRGPHSRVRCPPASTPMHSYQNGTPVFPLYDYLITTGPEFTAFWTQDVPLGIFTLMLLTRALTISLVVTGFVYTWAVSEVSISMPPPFV